VRLALARDLTTPGADLGADLGLHQLPSDHPNGLLKEVVVLIHQRLGDDLSHRHAPVLGHRGAPPSVDLQVNRRVWGPRWPELIPAPPTRYTTSTDVTRRPERSRNLPSVSLCRQEEAEREAWVSGYARLQ